MDYKEVIIKKRIRLRLCEVLNLELLADRDER